VGGNLRVARSIVASDNQETTSGSSSTTPAAKTVHKKENQNTRKLAGINKPKANTLTAAQHGRADATHEKRQRMKGGLIGRRTSNAPHATSPMHNLKLKDPPHQQSQPEEETEQDNDNNSSSNNNNFDVNIVGGEQSDPGEFPYYGK
jgi:hypothetical protein